MTISWGLRRRAHFCLCTLMRAVGFEGEEGNALLECAVTLPLLLTVMMGAASFSMAFYEMQELGTAVSGAAQVLGATAGTITDPCAQVVAQVTAAVPNLDSTKLTYTVTITNAAGTTATYGPTTGSLTCKAAGAGQAASTAEATNEPQTVTVSYNYKWMPLYFSKTPTSQLTSSATAMGE